MSSMLHVTETAPARAQAWKTRIIPALLAAAAEGYEAAATAIDATAQRNE
ncbi:MAG: hypothetical protein ACREXS_08140 [Gammaproteobacteria bacterium]